MPNPCWGRVSRTLLWYLIVPESSRERNLPRPLVGSATLFLMENWEILMVQGSVTGSQLSYSFPLVTWQRTRSVFGEPERQGKSTHAHQGFQRFSESWPCEMPRGSLSAGLTATSVSASRAESCPVAAVPSGNGSDASVRDCSPSVKPLFQRVHNLNSLMMMAGLYFMKKQRHHFADKVHLVKAMVFPVVIYRCESRTIKKAECEKIDTFEMWCWRRLLRVPWTARRSNQSILKEISPRCSLEGLMLKLKLQHSGHLV